MLRVQRVFILVFAQYCTTSRNYSLIQLLKAFQAAPSHWLLPAVARLFRRGSRGGRAHTFLPGSPGGGLPGEARISVA